MPWNERDIMHVTTESTAKLRERIFDYTRMRLEMNPPPIDGPATPEFLQAATGEMITEEGLGGDKAFDLFDQVLARACITVDHPNFVSFIPCAPTEAASLFDLVVSASSIFGGSWLEGAGALHAENQVLKWLAREANLPEGAGGVFVSGGTAGNLSALVTARYQHIAALNKAGVKRPERFKFICSEEAHSSLAAAANVMDVDIVKARVSEDGKLFGPSVAEALAEQEPGSIFAIIATSGTTNFGIVDDLRSIGEVARENGIWFHIDGAYGMAGILSDLVRPLYDGSELADSFIVDPHKWLFAPYDVCALIYREPQLARSAHTQKGEYLATLQETDDWNPSEFAYHLTRRVRGLPLWFSLATHGVGAYRKAVTEGINVARRIAEVIESRPKLSLVRKPELSVVAFKRQGWTKANYQDWSDWLLETGVGLVVPSSHKGEPMTRFAIINPETKFEELVRILDLMDEFEEKYLA
jgi:L-2,4-diaminobutyrate decarboxylase